MPASRIAAVGLAFLLAVGVAACGGDDGGEGGDSGGSGEAVSAEAYAADVCGAMQDWVTGIQERTESLTESFQSGDPQEGKDLLSNLLSEMSAQTGDLVGAVEDAGVPDVDGGEEAADSLVTAFEEVQGILDDAQQDIEELPTDPQAFQQGAAQLGPTLQEALSSVGSSIEAPDSQELKDAFENEESCSAIP
ncbi:MAG TPA: hypothetical protein VEU29_04690 [Actinomycetota bacterium]|nr:hypothetical protein [Actinomycetota bacterium]